MLHKDLTLIEVSFKYLALLFRSWKVILAFGMFGILMGSMYGLFRKNSYQVTVELYSVVIPNTVIEKIIDPLGQWVNSKKLLQDALQIDSAMASQIAGIDLLLENKVYSMESIGTEYEKNHFTLTIGLWEKSKHTEVVNAVINYLSRNNYIEEKLQLKNAQVKRELQRLNEEIVMFDSLRNLRLKALADHDREITFQLNTYSPESEAVKIYQVRESLIYYQELLRPMVILSKNISVNGNYPRFMVIGISFLLFTGIGVLYVTFAELIRRFVSPTGFS